MTVSLEGLYRGESLTAEQTEQLFGELLRGEMDPIVLSSLLTAMKVKGESPSEIEGAARALIAAAKPFPRPDYEFCDIVGTGGDGLYTINISSTAAIVGATCGIKVAKHGNRSVSSKTGSSDLLEKLGIKLDMSPETARRCLDEANICFLFAPHYHSGMRFAAPVRQALKTRTIFNVLGPLINPARPTYQLMGVYSPELLEPIAETLQALGLKKGMVAYGSGLDEIAVHGETQVAEINDGKIRYYTLTPNDFGLKYYTLESIQGGTPDENRKITEALLAGKGTDAQQTAIAINLAPLLMMGGLVDNLEQGAEMAMETLRSGDALDKVHQLAALSHKE
ncbi:anthranilate phosphoribosyltransferase [Tolumonas osonensis]|uniref:Anthranilate phosphoribosyltransferase n=1 Tax=Tolumonas osonensis TaxID=675874 RepID=A0A841GNE9_9GAMM|nr:anthranilate phosphoribosyltransferase [Tolumonas osonensis]MBB6056300.1 anthranilate phosphoribosyltransferase [Tolumonas osonensis]